MFWFVAWVITSLMLIASVSTNFKTLSLNAEMIETIRSLQGGTDEKENNK